jgi:hypothetical protein
MAIKAGVVKIAAGPVAVQKQLLCNRLMKQAS